MRFTQLPLDILCELRFYLEIHDIISLSRTSRILRDVFLSISWNVCMDNMSSVQLQFTSTISAVGQYEWMRQNGRSVPGTVLNNPHRYSWFLQDSVHHIVPGSFRLWSFLIIRKHWLQEFFLSFPNLQNLVIYERYEQLEMVYFDYPAIETMVALKGLVRINLKRGKRYDFQKAFLYHETNMNITDLYIWGKYPTYVPNTLNGTVGPLQLDYVSIHLDCLSVVTEMLKCLSSIHKCEVMEITVDVNEGNFPFGVEEFTTMLENIPTTVNHLDLIFLLRERAIRQRDSLQETLIKHADDVGTRLKDNLVLHKIRKITYDNEVLKSFADAFSINCPFKCPISHC